MAMPTTIPPFSLSSSPASLQQQQRGRRWLWPWPSSLFIKPSFVSSSIAPRPLPSPLFINATSVASEPQQEEALVMNDNKLNVELLACPICFEPLTRMGPIGLNRASISRSGFSCKRCEKSYSSRDVFLDLTITASTREYEEFLPPGTELFRSPFVSFLYERGWRQNFARSGFPGPDEEVELAQQFLKPAVGGVLLDVSCGSGLFSRRFAKTGAYSAIIASDFSENMLRQCKEFIGEDRSLDKLEIALVRADVARLPFSTATIDCVHAGAALHCWPSPSAGVAEISRILKPGGVFVATTFLTNELYFPQQLIRPLQQAVGRSFRYWREAELEDLCRACGLVDYKKIRKGNFIMLSACKPK